MKSAYLLAAPLAVLIIGWITCRVKHSHVCRYVSVQGRLRFYEGDGYTIEYKGRETPIEVTGPDYEFHTYRALEPTIVSGLDEIEKRKNNQVIAVGKVSTCVHVWVPANADSVRSEYHGLTVEEYAKNVRYLIMEKWYIKKPFYETRWIGGENNPTAVLVKRTALKSIDFGNALNHMSISSRQSYLKKHVR